MARSRSRHADDAFSHKPSKTICSTTPNLTIVSNLVSNTTSGFLGLAKESQPVFYISASSLPNYNSVFGKLILNF